MKKFKLMAEWKMQEKVEVEAETLEDAIDHVYDIAETLKGQYIDDSFFVNNVLVEIEDIKGSYSKNQLAFISAACREGREVEYTYSGRWMYGKTCPSVKISSLHDFHPDGVDFKTDNLGKGFIVYCPS